MSDEKEWDMSLELDPIVIINRHVALNEKLTAERDALKAENRKFREALAYAAPEQLNVSLWIERCEELEAERDRYREVIAWIASQKDLFFAECTQAEEIIERYKSALGEKPE